jgi:hypothetical protein
MKIDWRFKNQHFAEISCRGGRRLTAAEKSHPLPQMPHPRVLSGKAPHPIACRPRGYRQNAA